MGLLDQCFTGIVFFFLLFNVQRRQFSASSYFVGCTAVIATSTALGSKLSNMTNVTIQSESTLPSNFPVCSHSHMWPHKFGRAICGPYWVEQEWNLQLWNGSIIGTVISCPHFKDAYCWLLHTCSKSSNSIELQWQYSSQSEQFLSWGRAFNHRSPLWLLIKQ